MKSSWSRFVCLIAAVVVWAFFLPALMDGDSIKQYQEASDGRFLDWIPPAMAVILSAIMARGGDIGLLMLFQSTACITGLREFSYSLLCEMDKGCTLSSSTRSSVATIVTLLFIIPINPLFSTP